MISKSDATRLENCEYNIGDCNCTPKVVLRFERDVAFRRQLAQCRFGDSVGLVYRLAGEQSSTRGGQVLTKRLGEAVELLRRQSEHVRCDQLESEILKAVCAWALLKLQPRDKSLALDICPAPLLTLKKCTVEQNDDVPSEAETSARAPRVPGPFAEPNPSAPESGHRTGALQVTP